MSGQVGARKNYLSQIVSREWGFEWSLLFAICVAWGLIFHQEVAGAFVVWTSNDAYNHCLLILPLTFYMLWQRRDRIYSVPPHAEFRYLIAIVPLALAWLGASIFGILEARQFIALSILQVMFIAVLGWQSFRTLLAPSLYLYFLVPTGGYLIPLLQDFTANFAVLGLQLFGVPVFSDGVLIDVPSGRFVVAEACAGLRFLVAAVAFGVFYACEIYLSWKRRILFIGLSIVIPLVANGFRALGLIGISEAMGSATAVMADHITFGWVFFSIVLLALIVVGRSFSDRDDSQAGKRLKVPPGKASPQRMKLASIGAAAALALAAAGPALGLILDAPADFSKVPQSAPTVDPVWRDLVGQKPALQPVVMQADRQFHETFLNGSKQVDRFVALYAWNGRTNNLIRSENRIVDEHEGRIVNSHRETVEIGRRKIEVNSAEIMSGSERRLVWWFYALNDTTAARALDVKRHQAWAYLTGKKCASAMVSVSAELAPDKKDTAVLLARFLGAMEPLPGYLCMGTPGPNRNAT